MKECSSDRSEFYKSALGGAVKACITTQLTKALPDKKVERSLSLGYASPYIPLLQSFAHKHIAIAPSRKSILTEESKGHKYCIAASHQIPVPDQSIDTITMVHHLEYQGNIAATLHEAERIVKNHGRIIIVMPCRFSPWARGDISPFAGGQRVGRAQFCHYIAEAGLEIETTRRALNILPIPDSPLLRKLPLLRAAARAQICPIAGVRIFDIRKNMLAPTGMIPAKKSPLFPSPLCGT